jgi:hypothetical protein
MKRLRPLLIGGLGLALTVCGGAVVAGGWDQAAPQAATPSGDPIGDLLRNQPPVESAPAGAPAPKAPTPVTPTIQPGDLTTPPTDAAAPGDAAGAVQTAQIVTEPDTPAPRRRLRVVVVEAIDKITADKMRFEVVVGGRPVRFNNSLIFSARACELSAPGEAVEDAVAYMDVSIEPKGVLAGAESRQIFRGWMFASSPAVSGLQHPLYDAWIVGCKT